MAKSKSKPNAIGANGANHKYVPAHDDGDSEAGIADVPDATAGTAGTAATAATAATATTNISYSDDEGNVIIEPQSTSAATPVSPIPESTEVNDSDVVVDVDVGVGVGVGDNPTEAPSACHPVASPELVAAPPTPTPTPTSAATPTTTIEVTVDASTSTSATSDVTPSIPLKRTSVCGAICNCFRAIFKACCCCCCCCCRRRTTNHAATGAAATPQ